MDKPDKWYISGPLGIGETEPYAPLVVSGEISLKSPDSGIHSFRLKRTDEDNRVHEWAFWHMNKDYRKNALEIWEYKADSAGKSCGGNAADGAMCGLRLAILEGGNVAIANELTVGAGGNAVLRTRHIEGKHGDNDDPDTLYLNWVSGKDVQIGEPTRRSNLAVLGNVGIGTTASDAPLEIQGGTKGKFQIGRGNLAFEGGNEGGNLHIESREGMYLNFYSNKPIFFGTGSVGIGTTEPKANLDVSGSIALMGKQAIHGYDSWLRLNQESAFSSGVHTPKLFFPGSLNVGGRQNGQDPGWGNAWFTGTITYDGHLNKLDVAEGDGHARIRAHDLWLGHSGRGLKNTGHSMGRALVDSGEKEIQVDIFGKKETFKTLVINFDKDWDAVLIDGRVFSPSSRKLKDNIQVLSVEAAKCIVSALEPVTYLYKNDRLMLPCLGFIAEDSPTEVVSPTRESITFNHIVAALTRVVKDQVQSISELQAQVDSLSDRAAKAGAS